MVQEFDFNMMKISEIIKRVTQICRSLHVVRLDLFGSFATGTATSRSDVDFVVYGEVDHEALEEAVEKIDTLRKIDFFYYDERLHIVYEDEEYVISYMILGIFLFLFGLRIIFLYI